MTTDALNPHSFGSYGASSLGGSLPTPDPDSQDSSKCPFTPDVPNDFSPSIPSLAGGSDKSVISKMEDMLSWMNNNPDSKTGVMVFLQFISNIMNDPHLTKEEKSEISKIVRSLHDSSGQDGSLFKDMLSLEFQTAYFGSGGQMPDFNGLIAMFSGDDALHQDAASFLGNIQTNWSQWLADNTNPDGTPKYSADQWYNTQNPGANIVGQFLKDSDLINPALRLLRLDTIDAVLASSKNPYVLVVLLMMLFSSGDINNDLGGLAGSSNWIKKRTNDVTDSQNGWQNYNWQDIKDIPTTPPKTVEEAQQFYKDLKDFQERVDNSPNMSDADKANIDKQVATIMNAPTEFVKGDGKDPKAPHLTLAELFSADPNQKIEVTYQVTDPTTGKPVPKQVEATYGQLLGYEFNAWHINSTPSSAPYEKPAPDAPATPSTGLPPQFGTTTSSLKSMGTTLTDMSQTVSLQVSQKSNDSNTMIGIMKYFLNDKSSGITAAESAAINSYKQN
jgi:hypothetical protein